MAVSNLEDVRHYSALGGMPKEQLVNIIKDREKTIKKLRLEISMMKDICGGCCAECPTDPFKNNSVNDNQPEAYSGA